MSIFESRFWHENIEKLPLKRTKHGGGGDQDRSECTNSIYSFKKSNEFGKYIVANRDINPGEVILDELPLAVGPWAELDFSCIGCYVPLETKHKYKCPKCLWILCCPECPGLCKPYGHSKEECKELRKNKVAALFEGMPDCDRRYMYEALFSLRCLLLRDTDKAKWDKLLAMDAHNEVRKKVPNLWKRNQKIIVDKIRIDWEFDQFCEEEIHTICGIIDVNCYQIEGHKYKARALYHDSTLLLHDCRANTTHLSHTPQHKMFIRSTVPIKKGEAITLNYGHILDSTAKRRHFLYNAKFFWCYCERCSDPTEFGTYMSALKCPKCCKGIVLPEEPLDPDNIWNCSNSDCSYRIVSKLVMQLENNLKQELAEICNDDIHEKERFLEKYKNTLHKNHFLFLFVKFTLCQQYGKNKGYVKLSLEQLKRKEQYCQELLEVFDNLDPGMSLIRGILFYEMHLPMLGEAIKLFNGYKINVKEFSLKLKKVIEVVTDGLKILRYEPKDSSEYWMVIESMKSMKELKRIYKCITRPLLK